MVLICRNQEAAAELLVRAGADVNYKNAVGLFPLAVAAAIGNHDTLRVLAKTPTIDLNDKASSLPKPDNTHTCTYSMVRVIRVSGYTFSEFNLSALLTATRAV